MGELLEEQTAAEAGDNQRPRILGWEPHERLVEQNLHSLLAALRVSEAPKLASVAVALSQERDRVVEEPLAE